VYVATFVGHIHGTVHFSERLGEVVVQVNLQGLPPSAELGFHIHEAGDLSGEGCKAACAHFNPFPNDPRHAHHGGRTSKVRHVGDLGNIATDERGVCDFTFTDAVIALTGAKNILGRAVVVHEKRDDEGTTGLADSLTTGNAGARIACAVIGWSHLCFQKP